MKLHRVLGLVLAIQLGAALSAFGQGSYKAEAIGAAPADVPAPIQSTLDTQGVRVSTDGGATLCEVWLRKTLPTNASPNPESDILYGALTEGALLGVVHFPNAHHGFPQSEYQSRVLHPALRPDPPGRKPHGRQSLSRRLRDGARLRRPGT